MNDRVWSPYQTAIFTAIGNPNGGNIIVKAVAGSGKSTTLVEGCARTRGYSHVMLAFNKAIAEELKSRGVNGKTFHSACYSPVTRARGTPGVETNKLRMLCADNMSRNEEFLYGTFACRLVGLARQGGVGCLVTETPQVWQDIIDHHDLELDNEGATIERAIELASDLLMWSNASHLVDFDDLLYFAVKDNIKLPQFDFVFVDEAQDTNMIQRSLLRKMMKPTSRLIAVGDPAQAIYGFRGADSNSLNMIAEEFHARTLPLTVSYRCGTDIVKHARKWVSHIEAAPGAPTGKVHKLEKEWNTKMFQADDLVVCRTTKPLVQLAYKLMKDRIPAKIMGKDIGAGLASLIKKQKCNTLDELLVKIEIWAAREVEKAIAKKMDAKAEAQQDKADAIYCLADTLSEDERTIQQLLNIIADLFTDRPGTNCLKLATIHKAKGMEADRVWWLNSSACPARWARRPWQQEQERNLCYVATTRAKTDLFLIEDGAGKFVAKDEPEGQDDTPAGAMRGDMAVEAMHREMGLDDGYIHRQEYDEEQMHDEGRALGGPHDLPPPF